LEPADILYLTADILYLTAMLYACGIVKKNIFNIFSITSEVLLVTSAFMYM